MCKSLMCKLSDVNFFSLNMDRIRIICLIWITLITNTVAGETGLEGDVRIASLMAIYEQKNDAACGSRVSVTSVMNAEAVTWYLRNLNEFGGLPLKIGNEIENFCKQYTSGSIFFPFCYIFVPVVEKCFVSNRVLVVYAFNKLNVDKNNYLSS